MPKDLPPEYEALRQRIAELEQQLAAYDAVSSLEMRMADFAQFLDPLPDGALITTLEGQILYANNAAYHQFGYGHVLVGMNIAPLGLHTQIQPPSTAWNIPERPLLRNNGETFEAEVYVSFWSTYPRAILFLTRDITERRDIEAAFRKSQERLFEIYSILRDVAWTANLINGRFTSISPMIESLSGYRADEIESLAAWREIVHPHDKALYDDNVQKLLSGQGSLSFQHRIIRKDGSIGWLSTQWQVILDETSTPIRIYGLSSDITELKESEAALRRSQSFSQKVTEASPYITFVIDWRKLDVHYLSSNISDLIGFSIETIQGFGRKLVDQLCHPEDHPIIYEALRDIVTLKAGEIRRYKCRLRQAKGNWVWVNIRWTPFTFLEDTTPEQIIGTLEDITEQEQSSKTLQITHDQLVTSRDALQRLITQLPVGIQVFDTYGICIDVNEAHLAIFGIKSREHIVNRYNILDDSLATSIGTTRAFLRALEGETVALGDLAFNFAHADPRFSRTTGQRIINVTIFPVFDHHRRVVQVVGMNHDITDRAEAEARRMELTLQTERVRLLEDLIGDISHDLKTPLTIIGTSTYMLRPIYEDDTAHRYLDRIDYQRSHLDKLIEGLLTMSRLKQMGELAMSVVDINGLLESITLDKQLLSSEKRLTITLALAPDMPLISGHVLELSRVFNNLLDNAIRYTPEGGWVRIQTYHEREAIFIEFADNGIGIEAKDLEHIFDRFYRPATTTTQGTGLGLAIVQQVIEMHKGAISVSSKVGEGTQFLVSLPLNQS